MCPTTNNKVSCGADLVVAGVGSAEDFSLLCLQICAVPEGRDVMFVVNVQYHTWMNADILWTVTSRDQCKAKEAKLSSVHVVDIPNSRYFAQYTRYRYSTSMAFESS